MPTIKIEPKPAPPTPAVTDAEITEMRPFLARLTHDARGRVDLGSITALRHTRKVLLAAAKRMGVQLVVRKARKALVLYFHLTPESQEPGAPRPRDVASASSDKP